MSAILLVHAQVLQPLQDKKAGFYLFIYFPQQLFGP